jgi:membrane peptidoglycan carboxypeptidase
VLDGMVITGALTKAERDAQVFPATIEFTKSNVYASTNGYLLDMVRRELIANGFTDEEIDQRGYRIVTTIDLGLQQMAIEEVAAIPADHSPNLRTALVTLEPATGAIRALYGGPDYLTQAQNAVTQDRAQAGSTFKPFALVAYLEAGNSLRSRFNGNSNIVIDGYSPDPLQNFGRGNGQSFGEIDVVKATANSVNTVYAAMNVEVGPDKTLDAATRAGVCASWPSGEQDCSVLEGFDVPSNVLGTASPHPLDMAQAFNTFNNQGQRTDPYIVQSVEYLDGDGIAYENHQIAERVFEADVMADTTYALTQVVEQGTGEKAQAIGYPVAGKTGTSNDNKSAWFIGFTPQLTTAVAMYQVGTDEAGNAVEETITPFGPYVNSQITGGSAPLDLWTAYMTRAMAGREVIQFPARADIGEPNRPPLTDVPNVIGMSEADATSTLQGVGFTVTVQRANDPNVAEGLVIAQNPAAPSQAEQGSAITIAISLGAGTSEVPGVVGQTEAEATTALEAAGFVVSVESAESATVPEGVVISQNPGDGSDAPPGATVTIVVSTGPPVVEPTTDPGGGG